MVGRGNGLLYGVVLVLALAIGTRCESQAIANCKNASDDLSLSATDPAVIVASPIRNSDRQSKVGFRIILRNDGKVPAETVCFKTDFVAFDGSSRDVAVHSSNDDVLDKDETDPSHQAFCAKLRISPGFVEGVNLSAQVSASDLPLTGVVIVRGLGNSTEKAKDSSSSGTPCTVASKPVLRSATVTAPHKSSAVDNIVWIPAFSALSLLAIGLIRFRRGLGQDMGLPQWTFSQSWATNATIAGGVFSIACMSGLLPEYPHFMNKQAYLALAAVYSIAVTLAPSLYTFGSHLNGASAQPEGTVLLFLGASSVTVWAVIGQLTSTGYVLAEFAVRGYLSKVTCAFLFGLLASVGIALVVYTIKTVKTNVDETTALPMRILEGEAVSTEQVGQRPQRWRVL